MTGEPDYIETNRRMWDEVVPIHAASKFYDVASFKAGRTSLLSVEREEVGDVRGKTLLHLQCHFGMDTLSWVREGATATGIDFSHAAIETARGLAAETGIVARFIESNLYDLPSVLDEQFDIVFTSYGTIIWLPDIRGWARIVARYVRPGGFFYIVDGHPMAGALADDAAASDLRLAYPYFTNGAPLVFEGDGDYAEPNAKLTNRRTYEFPHTLGETITALVEAGLRIEYLHEFPFCAWARLPSMQRDDDGYYRLPEDEQAIPFLFSIKATKPG